jgi:hypothetical protein
MARFKTNLVLKVIVPVLLALTAPAWAQTQQEAPRATQDRQQLMNVSGALRTAISTGATAMLRQVRQEAPRAEYFFTGVPEVQGYRFPEGPLFTVQVPELQPSNQWAIAQILEQQRRQLQRAQVESGRGVVATNVGTTSSPDPSGKVPLTPPPSPYLDDPNAANAVYTREVQWSLIDAMLQYSKPLRIAPTQALRVVARSIDFGRLDPRSPGSANEDATIYFSIKGSDLAALHEGKITLEQARKLVSILED